MKALSRETLIMIRQLAPSRRASSAFFSFSLQPATNRPSEGTNSHGFGADYFRVRHALSYGERSFFSSGISPLGVCFIAIFIAVGTCRVGGGTKNDQILHPKTA